MDGRDRQLHVYNTNMILMEGPKAYIRGTLMSP